MRDLLNVWLSSAVMAVGLIGTALLVGIFATSVGWLFFTVADAIHERF